MGCSDDGLPASCRSGSQSGDLEGAVGAASDTFTAYNLGKLSLQLMLLHCAKRLGSVCIDSFTVVPCFSRQAKSLLEVRENCSMPDIQMALSWTCIKAMLCCLLCCFLCGCSKHADSVFIDDALLWDRSSGAGEAADSQG